MTSELGQDRTRTSRNRRVYSEGQDDLNIKASYPTKACIGMISYPRNQHALEITWALASRRSLIISSRLRVIVCGHDFPIGSPSEADVDILTSRRPPAPSRLHQLPSRLVKWAITFAIGKLSRDAPLKPIWLHTRINQ